MTLNIKPSIGKINVRLQYLVLTALVVLSSNSLEAQSGTTDAAMNWVQTQSYDEHGTIIAGSKSFFDQRGLPLQSQTLNRTENNVLVSQPLYDAFGRAVLNTLPAPIQRSGFSFKDDFVQTTDGAVYDFTHFDEGAKRISPDAIGSSRVGTLGWYYSDSNNVEPYVAASAFPYSRDEYYEDGSGQIKRSAGAGYAHRLGAGHEIYSHNFPIQQELDGDYLTIRNAHVFPGSPLASWENCGVSTVTIDPNGRSVVAFSDADGNVLASAVPGSDAPSRSVDVSLEVPLPALYFANLSGSVASIDGTNTLKIRVIGNHVVQVFDQNLSGSNKLVFQGLVGDRELVVPFTSSGNSFNLQVRSLSPFNYQVLRANGQWQALGMVQTTEERNNGTEFYLPPGRHSVTLTNNFPAISTIDARFEKVDVDSVFHVAVSGTRAKTLSGGFYRFTYSEDSDALDSFPLYTDYRGNVAVGYRYDLGEWSYNYYDDADRLVASISPNGVKQLQEGVPYGDIDKTTYEYNYQGWLLAQESKDAGRSEFMYRKDGAIRFSQNAQQRETGVFSYTNYDTNGLPIESGEFDPVGTSLTFGSTSLKAILEDRTASGGLPYGFARSDWNRTAYDVPDPDFQNESGLSGYHQDFVMGTVSYTENEHAKTWYSYDDQARVSWVAQHIKELGRTFTIDYQYDLLGNVLEMVYQRSDAGESFYHHYTYDADQRLSQVFTSEDGSDRTLQATYEYYLHGPLKRVELGGGLQGIDYVYTIQGMLKAINHPSLMGEKDPGGDNDDLFGLALDYYSGDYNREGNDLIKVGAGEDRFSGNVKALTWNTGNQIDPDAMDTYFFGYNDQDWLEFAHKTTSPKERDSIRGIPYHDPTYNRDYHVYGITYDANGNILSLNRNKQTENGSNAMDQFSYVYKQDRPNQLDHVDDAVAAATDADDLKDQEANNYVYNNIGQLVEDRSQGLRYTYNVSGLVTEVAKNGIPLVKFYYDDRGHRSRKESFNTSTGTLQTTTYYVRDVAGSTMGVYARQAGGSTSLVEQSIYGSGRLGIHKRASGTDLYELTDHLGNVRAVIARNGKDAVSLVSSTDYYPFGMPMPGRDLVGDYRYNYQGQELDKETGKVAFELRLYDPRIARWSAPDPAGQYASPYLAMGNNPISRVDPDGGMDGNVEEVIVTPDISFPSNTFTNSHLFTSRFSIDLTADLVKVGKTKELSAKVGLIFDKQRGLGGTGTLSVFGAEAGGKLVPGEGFKPEFGAKVGQGRQFKQVLGFGQKFDGTFLRHSFGFFEIFINPLGGDFAGFTLFGNGLVNGKQDGKLINRTIMGLNVFGFKTEIKHDNVHFFTPIDEVIYNPERARAFDKSIGIQFDD